MRRDTLEGPVRPVRSYESVDSLRVLGVFASLRLCVLELPCRTHSSPAMRTDVRKQGRKDAKAQRRKGRPGLAGWFEAVDDAMNSRSDESLSEVDN